MTKKWTVVLMAIVLAAGMVAVPTIADDDGVCTSIGVKVFLADSWDQTLADGGDVTGDGTLYGPTLSLAFPNGIWVSAMYLLGTYELDPPPTTGLVDLESDYVDAEGFVGYQFSWLDLGLGMRYVADDQSAIAGGVRVGEKFERGGPAVYAATGGAFGDTCFSWFAGASWLFYNMMDDDVGGHDQYVTAEAGLFASLGDVTAAVGYRYKQFEDGEDQATFAVRGTTIRLIYAL